jgi:[acyl-carrier-protein] S-malonyltransferase
MAWIFPGQGSQEPGMGRDLYEGSAAARATFDRADAVLDRPISTLCFEGSDAELALTSKSQPAIYTTSVACLQAAREAGVLAHPPAFVAGHSLGEYSALTAAEALDFEDGLRLVETRGRLTQAAADACPQGMAAVLGLDLAEVEQVVAEAGAEVSNINAPGQVVIGGAKDAVARAIALAQARGARRAVALDVGGAFHSSLMRPAVDGMREALASVKLRTPRVPFVANDRGRVLAEPDAIREELLYQLTHPVCWVDCVRHMADAGVTRFVEIGPGRVLTGLVKRIIPGAETVNINGMKALRS